MQRVSRGATPSPRHRLASAMPHRIIGVTPSQILYNPAQLSMWLNDEYGDCVTAEEAFAKACYNPEIFITDGEVQAWASKHNVLNGTDLTTVLDFMQNDGFQQNGTIYDDGPPIAVDWTNADILQNALAQGPVKTGIAADQIEEVYQQNPSSGWLATGFSPDTNEDHCVSLCGFGSFAWLFGQLGVLVPSGFDPTTPGFAMFTWKSIGVIDFPSLQAIVGEAWLRNPTTVIPGSQS